MNQAQVGGGLLYNVGNPEEEEQIHGFQVEDTLFKMNYASQYAGAIISLDSPLDLG